MRRKINIKFAFYTSRKQRFAVYGRAERIDIRVHLILIKQDKI